MTKIEPLLKQHHRFSDYLYWNLVAAVPMVTACSAIFKNSIAWFVVYVGVCIASVAVIYRFYCTHCPHYIQGVRTTRCMFFWGMPKFFTSNPGPLDLTDKLLLAIASAVVVGFPLYWLFGHGELLAVYILSYAVLITTIRRNECQRCVYFECPVNRVPEDVRSRLTSP